jgi:hypothetical protein
MGYAVTLSEKFAGLQFAFGLAGLGITAFRATCPGCPAPATVSGSLFPLSCAPINVTSGIWPRELDSFWPQSALGWSPLFSPEPVEAGGDDPCREAHSAGVSGCFDALMEVELEAEVGADGFHSALSFKISNYITAIGSCEFYTLSIL